MEQADTDFRILGPLEVAHGDRRVELGGRKQRALLAILLLRANEVVSADTLIDELWGHTPPPTATKTLRAHVSRLRKALDGDAGLLETRGHGYLLKIEPAQLDAERFQRLLEDGRRALARREAESAVAKLDAALALWRGPALADFAYDSFARGEIERLEELRLSAVEERIDAELALGRHGEVVAELETLVARHPLRERLRGQLMVALYRSDRQAEALDVYQRGRRALAEELGLQPSEALQQLERQILEHDPVLAAPARAERPLARAPVRTRLRGVVLAGSLALAAVLGAALFQLTRDGTDAATQGTDLSAVGVLDAGKHEVRDRIPLGAAPSTVATPPTAIAAGLGFVWAASADSSSVVVVDPTTKTVRDTIAVESAPGGIAIGGGWVWVTNSLTGTVSQISPQTLSVVQTVPVGNGPTGIAAGNGQVWVANTSDHTVSKLRARDGKPLGTFPAGPDPGAVALGEGALWVASKLSAAVVKVSPKSGEVLDRIAVGHGPAGVAVGAGSVWVANSLSGTVSRLDPRTGDVRGTVEIGPSADAVAIASGDVWVASGLGRAVSRVRDGRATTVDVGDRPTALAAGDGTVYVALRPSGASHAGGTLRVLSSSPMPRHIDTATAYAPELWTTLALTNDGLVGWRRVGGQAGTEMVPDLAVSLPTVSDDGRTYTFQLRRGVRYSNGQLLKASDVRYSLERVYTPYDTDFVAKRVGNYQHHPLWGTLFAQLWVR
ncbi:MAG TPA: BTAD domain-containing putative transcriptional regulator [Gaiellaceae bacterium]|nr:BTAD domain-containing putative transcriptional regulator [Gaiellaceae bacterium]